MGIGVLSIAKLKLSMRVIKSSMPMIIHIQKSKQSCCVVLETDCPIRKDNLIQADTKQITKKRN